MGPICALLCTHYSGVRASAPFHFWMTTATLWQAPPPELEVVMLLRQATLSK